jgi:hypothetical protein
VKIGTAQRIFVVDFEEEESCNSHIAQKPLIKGVLSASSDTDAYWRLEEIPQQAMGGN